MGADAFLCGQNEDANPHAEGSIAHIEWLRGHLDAKVESRDLNESEEDCARVYLSDTHSEARRYASGLLLDLPTATAVGDAIGLPVKEWKHKCFAVSVAALESGILDEFQEKHGPLFPAYGMYDGPIAPGRRSFNRHGWLESVRGHVVDPTRWVFTDEYPHLWAGRLDDYDLGGMRLRSAYRPTVAPRPEGTPFQLGINDQKDLAAFDRVLRRKSVSRTGMISTNELHWILTCPLEELGDDADLFIRVADRLGLSGLVPIDTRLWLDFSTNGYDPAKLRATHNDLPDQHTVQTQAPSYSPF
jgi:hypothetical protein